LDIFLMSLYSQGKIIDYDKIENSWFWAEQVYEIEKSKNINEWLFLNTNNWNVTYNLELIWNIKLGTLEYKFFEYLINNKWIAKSHEEIIANINPNKMWKTSGSFCSDIKRRLPANIRNLIKSPKSHYLIP
jgi:hypothetical protein